MVTSHRNILFITSFHPGASGYIGAGEAISAETVQRLRREGAQVHVLVVAPRYQRKNAVADSWCDSYTEVTTSRFTAIFGIIGHLFSGAAFAPWFFTRTSGAAVEAVKQAIDKISPTELWIDFPSSLGFAQHVRTLPIHYFVHDVVSQNVARSPLKRWLFPWVKQVEASLLRHVGHCYLLSGKDEKLLRDLKFTGPTEVWGVQGLGVGTVDGGRPIASVVNEFGPGPNLVFFGNMGRPENSWSVVHFVLFRWWHVRRVFPSAQFWVLGLAPSLFLRMLGRLIPGLKVVGAVDDPTQAFQSATLCVAPLLFGAGVKVKVLQMLEAGATVIATPVGAEGIDASARLIVVSNSEMATGLIDYLRRLNSGRSECFPQTK